MNKKIFWGILAFAPITVIVLVIIGVSLDPIFAPPLAVKGTVWGDYWWAIIGGVSFAVTILFMANVPINKNVDKGKKILWMAVIIFGSIWVIPFYWWFYLRDSD
ncbi:hypothetical protein [Kaarinaea lacus]